MGLADRMGERAMRFVLGVVAFAIMSPAFRILADAPQTVSLLGVSLAQPITFHSCPTTGQGLSRMYDAAKGWKAKEPCVMPLAGASRGELAKWREVHFPMAIQPYFLDGFVSVWTKEWRAEIVQFQTYGIRVQDNLIHDLQEKFGDPTTIETPVVQNRLGASFRVIRARWALPSATITFDSARNGLDSGFVAAETGVGSEMRKKWLEDRQSHQQKL